MSISTSVPLSFSFTKQIYSAYLKSPHPEFSCEASSLVIFIFGPQRQTLGVRGAVDVAELELCNQRSTQKVQFQARSSASSSVRLSSSSRHLILSESGKRVPRRRTNLKLICRCKKEKNAYSFYSKIYFILRLEPPPYLPLNPPNNMPLRLLPNIELYIPPQRHPLQHSHPPRNQREERRHLERM